MKRYNFLIIIVLCVFFLPIISKAALGISAVKNIKQCSENSTAGSASLVAKGSGAPFTYNLIDAQGQVVGQGNIGATGMKELTGLKAGKYKVEVRNKLDCPITVEFEIICCEGASEGFVAVIPPPIVVSGQVIAAFGGVSNGSINLSATGGQGKLYFKWTDANGNIISTKEDVANLPNGKYCVEVTDGCETVKKCFNLTDVCPPLTIKASVENACGFYPTGSVKPTVLGGTGPYSYEWSNGSKEKNLIDINSATYGLIITDLGSGCTAQASFSVDATGSDIKIVPVYNECKINVYCGGSLIRTVALDSDWKHESVNCKRYRCLNGSIEEENGDAFVKEGCCITSYGCYFGAINTYQYDIPRNTTLCIQTLSEGKCGIYATCNGNTYLVGEQPNPKNEPCEKVLGFDSKSYVFGGIWNVPYIRPCGNIGGTTKCDKPIAKSAATIIAKPKIVENANISLVPNPFSENVILEIGSSIANRYQIECFDITGKSIYQTTFMAIKGINKLELSQSDIQDYQGILFFKVETEDKTFSQTIKGICIKN